MAASRSVMIGERAWALSGDGLVNGQPAPNFTALDVQFRPVSLEDFRGKTVLIASLPSLSTGVCDRETRRFNEEAANLGEDIRILAISMDLPFTLGNWCAAAGVDRVLTLSDTRDRQFGDRYGVNIPERGHLSRAVFVVDPQGTLRHVEYVPALGQEPDYAAALAALRSTG